jgi:glycosyltransferase involved in cell wall biosynthesis
LFLDADVFVLPTHADCLPVVLQEAAAAGLPVITTDVGAVRECVVQGESGWVIPPDDVQSLRSAIETIVNDSGQRVQMGRAARQLALRKFDATRNARGVIDYLREAAEQRTAAPRAA